MSITPEIYGCCVVFAALSNDKQRNEEKKKADLRIKRTVEHQLETNKQNNFNHTYFDTMFESIIKQLHKKEKTNW